METAYSTSWSESTASLRDLNSGTVPVGAAVSFANFGGQLNWGITLTQLLPGIFSPPPGKCAPVGAAFIKRSRHKYF